MPSPAATPPASEDKASHLRSRSRSPFYWTRPSEETIEDIVNATKAALETSKDFLELAPVPGLSAAVGTVLSILEQVQKTKANRKTVKAFCDRTLELKDTLEKFNARLREKINNAGGGLEAEVRAKAEQSEDLKARITKLAEDVKAACAIVANIGKQSGFRALLSASRDEDALKDAEAGIVKSMTTFQMIGGITVEMLVDNIVNAVQDIRREQEAAARRELEIIERQKEEAQRRQKDEEAKSLKELLPLNTELSQATNRPQSAYVKDTRTEVFEQLNAWRSRNESIFYLSGQLGRGKSVVALEFCERYKEDVAASFFFKRGTGAGSSVNRLVPVIAYQLAQASPALRPHIAKAAQEYFRGQKSLKIDTLVEVLLAKPLSAAAQSMDPAGTRLYIVMDAVDECTDSDTLSAKFLAQFLPCICANRFLRLLITSRPFPVYISDAIYEHAGSVRMLSLDNDINRDKVDADMRLAITDILSTNPTSHVWYSRHLDVIDVLLEASGGLFVYACTAARFLSNVEESFLTSCMTRLLSKERPYGLDDLETLYVNVLDAAFPEPTRTPEYVEAVRTILGVIALGNVKMDADQIERLFAIPCDQSMSILRKLRSVIQFGQSTLASYYEPWEIEDLTEYFMFTPIHVTFGDFLLRPTSHPLSVPHFPYHIDSAVFHARLAVACVRNIHDPGDYVTNYACNRWFRQFLEAVKAQELDTITKAEPSKTGDLLKELSTLFESIVSSMNTVKPSVFFHDFEHQLPWDNPDEVATLLLWIDQNTSRNVAQVFAEWIGMWRRQYEIRMDDMIVVKMRGDTPEDKKIKDTLKIQLDAHCKKLWNIG